MYIVTINDKVFVTPNAPVFQDAYEVEVPVKISTLYSAAKFLYQAGYKIEAIKLVRPFIPNQSLKDAKDFVDSEFGEKTPPKIEWHDCD